MALLHHTTFGFVVRPAMIDTLHRWGAHCDTVYQRLSSPPSGSVHDGANDEDSDDDSSIARSDSDDDGFDGDDEVSILEEGFRGQSTSGDDGPAEIFFCQKKTHCDPAAYSLQR